MFRSGRRHFAILLATTVLALPAPARAEAAPPGVEAVRAPLANRAPLLSAARAGERIVAVGEYGIVLLSDDAGQTWRQARRVPVSSMLTDVTFVDAKAGWAVGHEGLVLRTEDGGETWSIAHRTDPELVLMAIAFDRAGRGVIVGTYGFALRTEDGGRTWQEIVLEDGDEADRHLNHVFVTAQGSFVVAAETGNLYRSIDGGLDWRRTQLPVLGSMWYGAALPDNGLLVAGMGGRLFRSGDDGATWAPVENPLEQSLTGVAALPGGGIVVVGLAGLVATSLDGARSFTAYRRSDRTTFAAALPHSRDEVLLFGLNGIQKFRLPK